MLRSLAPRVSLLCVLGLASQWGCEAPPVAPAVRPAEPGVRPAEPAAAPEVRPAEDRPTEDRPTTGSANRPAPGGGEWWGEHLVFSVNAEAPGPVVVLLHGYGAPRDDLVPFARWLVRQPGLAATRFFMLGAPIGMGRGAAWWTLDAPAERERRRAAGDLGEDETPAGLVEARAKVVDFLRELSRREGVTLASLTIGGFSQGAMLSVDVALHLPEPPRRVVALSGAVRGGETWPETVSGLRAFVSHGRRDPLLPFELGEHLRDRLRERGAEVTFVPFDGVHSIAPEVRVALASFLRD